MTNVTVTKKEFGNPYFWAMRAVQGKGGLKLTKKEEAEFRTLTDAERKVLENATLDYVKQVKIILGCTMDI